MYTLPRGFTSLGGVLDRLDESIESIKPIFQVFSGGLTAENGLERPLEGLQ